MADDQDDSEQVALVRAHLRKGGGEIPPRRARRSGEIHGMEMPGLAELEAGASRIEIVYDKVLPGGQIRYCTDDPALIAALHACFDAQVSDHGADAKAEGR